MARYGLDAAAFFALARTEAEPVHQLVGAADLRSAAMALLYREHRAGQIADAEVAPLLDRITALKARLLGDRVSRAVAWCIASELGLDDPREVECLAVTRLQADALVALDPRIRSLAEGVVPLADFAELTRG